MDNNIILINIDGFRQDRINKCPKLKNLKENSYFFSEMNTVAPYTFASLHAIFSGMYPSRNGVNAYYNMFKFKKNEITTIPQFLKESGYYTSCDVISESAMPRQGYDEWNMFEESTVDFKSRHKGIIERLSKKEKFFLFLHFTETHKYLVRDIVQKYKQEDNDDEFFENKEENESRFDSYLPSCDSYIETIVKTINDCGIEDNTILILFSDHGTSLGEKKGEKFYGVFTYDYTVRIFCIMKIPGKTPKIIDNQCRSIDIFSTIADISGMEMDERFERVQGESLFQLIKSEPQKERDVFVETGGLYGPWPSPKKHNVFCIKSKKKKLIYNDTPQTWEFYDLENDPNEENNLYDEKLLEIKEYKEKLMFYFQENNIITNLHNK